MSWDQHKGGHYVDVEELPAGTTTVRVRLADQPDKDYWMLLRRPQAELCTRSVGLVEDLLCDTESVTLVDAMKERGPPLLVRSQQMLGAYSFHGEGGP